MTTSSDPQPQQQEGPERISAGPCTKCGAIVAGLNACPYCGCNWIGTRVQHVRATAEAELTVESALAELREMFPGEGVSIEVHDYTNIAAGNGYVKIVAGWRSTTHPSLEACMEIARRRWSKSRAATSEGGG